MDPVIRGKKATLDPRLQKSGPTANNPVSPQQSSPTSPTAPLGNQANSEKLRKKHERMHAIKEFLTLKRKINQLINLNKSAEAKQAYDALYKEYEDLTKILDISEIARFRNDLATIYTSLTTELSKRVKRASTKEASSASEGNSTIKRKRIITTDLDVVLQIVDEKGRINLAEIQSRFDISKILAEEWIQILADYGLVQIRYLPIGGVEITKIK